MAVQLEYVVTQHIRDRELLEGLEGYLGCGKGRGGEETNSEMRRNLEDIYYVILCLTRDLTSLRINGWWSSC